MLRSKAKVERRRYARAKVACPIKLVFVDGKELYETTEEISFGGFHFLSNLAEAMSILPDGLNNLSRANPVPCTAILMPEGYDFDEILLEAQMESMTRLSQDLFKVLISFDDDTLNLENYQKFKNFVEHQIAA